MAKLMTQRDPPARSYLEQSRKMLSSLRGVVTIDKGSGEQVGRKEQKQVIIVETGLRSPQRKCSKCHQFTIIIFCIANVNEYLHLARPSKQDITDNSIPDNIMNLDWILHLREQPTFTKKVYSKDDVTKTEPYQVYFKTIKRESRTKKDQLLQGGGNFHDILHLATDRRMCPVASNSDVSYLGNLRSHAQRPQTAVTHPQRFSSVTSKSSQRLINSPEFLPPSKQDSIAQLAKLDGIRKVVHLDFNRHRDTISSFESKAHVFPKYDDRKAFQTSNANERAHLIKDAHDINVVVWESNLRVHKTRPQTGRV